MRCLRDVCKSLTTSIHHLSRRRRDCRVLLSLGEEEYDDVRYGIDETFQSPEFKAAKEKGELCMNLNRAPVLVAPSGQVIGQSKAIERYLARRFKLMGQTPDDEAIIDLSLIHI